MHIHSLLLILQLLPAKNSKITFGVDLMMNPEDYRTSAFHSVNFAPSFSS